MEWISVKDRLPGFDGEYLVMFQGKRTILPYEDWVWWWGDRTIMAGDFVEEISHWMPLPEPPKE